MSSASTGRSAESDRPAGDRGCLVVVGCSWGGLSSLNRLLGGLPADLDVAIVVAQHHGPRRSSLADLLTAQSPWPVCEAEDKMPVRLRSVQVAPAGYHLMIEGDHLALSTDAPVRHSRPSIDVLFETAAKAYAEHTVAVVLTGANDDGAAGVREVSRRGGRIVVEDPASAERPEMPSAVVATGLPLTICTPEEMGPLLGDLCRRSDAEVPPWRTPGAMA